MKLDRREIVKLLAAVPVLGNQGLQDNRNGPVSTWLGPEFWSNPLQDWQLRNGRMECIVSGGDRNVFALTRELTKDAGELLMSVFLGRMEADSATPLREGFVGFRVGIQGTFHDYRDNAIYGQGWNAGIDEQGRLYIGSLSANAGKPISGYPRDVHLHLEGKADSDGCALRLSAMDENGNVLASAERTQLPLRVLIGGVALVCSSGLVGQEEWQPQINHTMSGPVVPSRKQGGNCRFWFRDWKITGSKVSEHPDRTFGPILWTMYTVSRGVLKVSAQMAPLGGEGSDALRLEIKRNKTWQIVSTARMDARSRSALFRVSNWTGSEDVEYRVGYGSDTFGGIIRQDPKGKPKFTLAALSCLNDFGFPHADLLASIEHFHPDLVAFQGDQIYERTGSYGIQTAPLEPAVLDYLRKWYLFGWAFRDLLRSTPSICQTDDHDMYHGNIWGAGGRHAEGTGQDAQDGGGYSEPAPWVNMVQRVQTSHLPDPYDPTPIDQDIGVYYTDLLWGGISFAILEDRKWKSAPRVLLPQALIRNGWAKNPEYNAARDGNVPGAELYGPRQLQFLDAWAQDWKGGVWMKVALTQTLLANVATLPRPANTDAVVPSLPLLKQGGYPDDDMLVADHDSNGWPQSGRNHALESFRCCSALHVCGDQHLGSTIQNGVADWKDAAFSFCSPALSNMFPRRWYPPTPGANPFVTAPRNSGDYQDGFGNKVTVHAVCNPEQVGDESNPLLDRSPGFGIIEFERDTRAITLTLWPRRTDPRSPDAEPAHGWPIRVQQLDNGWSNCEWKLPPVTARGHRDFCVQITRQAKKEPLYTLRVNGSSFEPPVRESGVYSVRVFDPETELDETRHGMKAQPKKAKGRLGI